MKRRRTKKNKKKKIQKQNKHLKKVFSVAMLPSPPPSAGQKRGNEKLKIFIQIPGQQWFLESGKKR